MDLTAIKRKAERKSEAKVIRRAGNIPAVLYVPGVSGETIEVKGDEFAAALRKIKPGMLATTIFDLTVDGKKIKAIVKDIQYDVTTYQVVHLDFEQLEKGREIELNIPINCTGEMDCVGIKLGGFKRQVIRSVRVKCLPENIPAKFDLDIRKLGMRQSKRLSDLTMPAGVKPLAKGNEVVVVIAKR